jgi:hypothetical protein
VAAAAAAVVVVVNHRSFCLYLSSSLYPLRFCVPSLT